MADFLLTTKLQIPPVRPNLVMRPRLLAQLDAGLAYPLTLVTAPPGSGKTTIVSAWLRSRMAQDGQGAHTTAGDEPPALQVAWLSLTEEDNEVTQFLTYLSTAVAIWRPGLADMVLALLEATPPPAPRSVVTLLINALSQLPTHAPVYQRTYVLVLDDYHLIHTPAIHDALTFLVEHSPAQFHLLLTSRSDPPLPLATWRARGQLAELRTADLRFTPEEAVAFLNGTMALALPNADVVALEARTEGWAAGLQLAALALRGRTDRAAFLQAFTGGHRYVLGYLIDEVLARQPEQTQRFLEQTAVLERLCGDLCDAVTGEPGSQRTLEMLHRANLFTIALDEEGKWYRYHHLFRDVLRLRLQQTQADLMPTLQQRASGWFEAHGFLDEAIEHALAAQDLKHASDLIVGAFLPLWKRSALGTLRRWIERLPEVAFHQHPDLAFWSAALLAYTGQLDLVETRLDLAEALYRAVPSAQAPRPEESRGRLGRVAWLRGMLAGRRGAASQALRFAEQAFNLLPPDDFLFRGGTFIILGLVYLIRDELVEAQHAYEQAVALARATDHWFLLSGALGRLAPLQVTLGRLRAAAASCRQLLALPIAQSGRLPAAGYAHVGLAEVCYQWGELDSAAEHVATGLALGEAASIVDLIHTAALVQARVKAAQGVQAEAFAMLRRAHATAPQVGGANVARRVQAVEALIQLRSGQIEATARWARSLTPLDTEDSLLSELEGLVQAHLQLAESQPDAALVMLQSLLLAAETAERLGSVIEILVLQARALVASGQLEAAIDTLKRALVLAEPEGYVQLFVDESAVMVELLRTVGRRGSAGHLRPYLSRLLAPCAETQGTAPPEPVAAPARPPASRLIEPLTEREQAVLRLVAEGAANEQIATTLVISIHTVRKHVSNILAKLAVASRTEAVARARQLGLL